MLVVEMYLQSFVGGECDYACCVVAFECHFRGLLGGGFGGDACTLVRFRGLGWVKMN